MYSASQDPDTSNSQTVFDDEEPEPLLEEVRWAFSQIIHFVYFK